MPASSMEAMMFNVTMIAVGSGFFIVVLCRVREWLGPADNQLSILLIKPAKRSLIFSMIAMLLVGCGSAPLALEREWEHKDATQSAFDMCMSAHQRNSLACSAE